MRLLPPILTRIKDEAVDRVLRNIQARIDQVQRIPIVGGVLFRDVEIGNNGNRWIRHSLGRRAAVLVSPPRGGASTSGRITDITEDAGVSEDRTKVVVLRAAGWGTDITVDVWIY